MARRWDRAAAAATRSALSVYLDERNRHLFTRRFYPALYPLVALTTLDLHAAICARGRAPNFFVALSGWFAGVRGEEGRPESIHRARSGVMMQMIRARSGLMLEAFRSIRLDRVASVAKWSIAILLIGLLTGAMAVILPPMASIGVVALVGVVLLWAMPELQIVPDGLLRKMFFVMVFVQLCVPAYYAIDTGFLPWISVRRFFIGTVILLFCITVAGSKAAREKISEPISNNRLLAFLSFGFLGNVIDLYIRRKYRILRWQAS